MTRMLVMLRRLHAWIHRDRLEAELADEMAFHEEHRRRALESEGMNAGDAMAAARRGFGNTTRLREEAREMWGFPSLETILQDLRYGARLLRRSPAFTATAVLSLAIGIGSSAAVFSLADMMLLRPLPVRSPEELVLLRWSSGPVFPLNSLDGEMSRTDGGHASTSFSLAAFRRMQAEAGGSVALFGFANVPRLNLGFSGEARSGSGHAVSGDYFQVLGVRPALGRTLVADDDNAGSPPAALVSHALWEQRLGGSADAVGRSILVNGLPFTIVGVLPAGFNGTGQLGASPDVFIPLAFHGPVARPGVANEDPNSWWLVIMGRAMPGVAPKAALAPLDAILKQTVTAARPDIRPSDLPQLAILPGSQGLQDTRQAMRAPFRLMAVVVAIVLLVACANVANLLMVRGRARVRELTVRVAIGAPRRRVVRQLLTEALMLAACGSALGLVAGQWIATVLLRALSDPAQAVAAPGLDLRSGAFVALLATICTAAAGLLPAWRATDLSPARGLQESARGAAARRGHRLTAGLVVFQIALSMVLVATAVLLARSVSELRQVDLGFDGDRLLVFRVDATLNGYSRERVQQTYGSILDALRGAPGVEGATMMSQTPLANLPSIGIATRTDETAPPFNSPDAQRFISTHQAWRLGVDPGYFPVMKIPILRGRGFEPQDATSQQWVAVINAALARQLFETDDVVGRSFRLGMGAASPIAEIVGVSHDTRYSSLRAPKPPTMYLARRATVSSAVTFAVRTAGDPDAFAGTARDIVRRIDATLPMMTVRSMAGQVRESVRREAMFARLAAALGLVTLALAAIGLYALQSYIVGQRTAEIGIRMALGAGQGAVRWMVLKQSLALAAAGLAAGVAGVLASAPVVEALLYNVGGRDPWILAGAAAVMLAVSMAAGYLPSRRASRVDPLAALRAE